MVVGVQQITLIFRNNRALSKFTYQILHYLFSIMKSKRVKSVKIIFTLTMRTTLNRKITDSAKTNIEISFKKFHVLTLRIYFKK